MLSQGLACLEAGGLMLLPVDTVPGLACRADHPVALHKLLTLKGRPPGKALALAFASVDQVLDWLPHLQARLPLLQSLFPGPWTVVVDSSPRLAALHKDWETSVGLRVPGPSRCQDLLHTLPWPLALSSANLSGQATARQVADVSPDLLREVDFIWPGDCALGQESTVLDVRGGALKVLRAGAGDLGRVSMLAEGAA